MAGTWAGWRHMGALRHCFSVVNFLVRLCRAGSVNKFPRTERLLNIQGPPSRFNWRFINFEEHFDYLDRFHRHLSENISPRRLLDTGMSEKFGNLWKRLRLWEILQKCPWTFINPRLKVGTRVQECLGEDIFCLTATLSRPSVLINLSLRPGPFTNDVSQKSRILDPSVTFFIMYK